MGILGIVLLVIFVIVSLLLILIVVIQNEESEGLGGIFSGSSSTAFGSRSSNVIVRFTYILGTLFFVTAFSLALLNKGSAGNVEAAALKKTQETQGSGEWWKAAESAPTTPEELPQAQVPPEPAPLPSGN